MLSEKLSSLNKKLKKESARKEDLNKAAVGAFCEKVKQSCAAQQIQFNILNERADRLVEEIDEERLIREDFEREIEREFYQLPETDEPYSPEQIGEAIIQREQSAIKDAQENISNLIDEKVFSISLALAKERK